MNSSPVKTGAIGSVTAAVVTIIAALVKHYNIDIPADAQVSIAVGIVSVAHWFGNAYTNRAKQPAFPAGTTFTITPPATAANTAQAAPTTVVQQ
jgi:hypothetical protein